MLSRGVSAADHWIGGTQYIPRPLRGRMAQGRGVGVREQGQAVKNRRGGRTVVSRLCLSLYGPDGTALGTEDDCGRRPAREMNVHI